LNARQTQAELDAARPLEPSFTFKRKRVLRRHIEVQGALLIEQLP
jgi:hypothetical protein